jgi:hypothetical protein
MKNHSLLLHIVTRIDTCGSFELTSKPPPINNSLFSDCHISSLILSSGVMEALQENWFTKKLNPRLPPSFVVAKEHWGEGGEKGYAFSRRISSALA